jgi:hypothetical protein
MNRPEREAGPGEDFKLYPTCNGKTGKNFKHSQGKSFTKLLSPIQMDMTTFPSTKDSKEIQKW